MAAWVTTSAAMTIWYEWNCDSSATAASASTDAWSFWCESNTSTACSDHPNSTWGSWVKYTTPCQPSQVTAEDAERLKRERDEWRKKAEEEQKRREAAERRAEELLKAHLTAEQRENYDKDKRFQVVSETGKRYEIRAKGLVGNVYEVGKNGRPVKRWCAHPNGVPLADALLAQKLALEMNEKEFLRVANPHQLSA